ncbi:MULTISPECIES: hypothetical protein [Nocardia]|uniref:Uncharacterized protein n=1 Tax=Nocardia asteroides NBRC 15531 TaxID=1110697 RepID=U5EPT4_NOCAS|nr:hypothetical protein [Nocardia asteroides]TLF63386.1 hypothetical protein FEK33_25460 [Nocardia asteroides NBRC 15531]UGT47185.1 hypothetical protein LT345_22055 [Nocardia asteroides]SFM77054.1 hypothetical protein SAMN05444423_104165 [Nocardia asteroides]VEG33933.1 Uncharacterised protein [Nocardia asteroides]GAD87089.1 hypothetical protein NCAST_34_02190 [Nocardia asteroides NBRC 15531]
MSKTKNAAVATETAAPAPEHGSRSGVVPVLRRDSIRALWAALRAHPDSTTAALADIAGIGLSTARRLLAQWETAGCAQSHTDPESPRAAKTWTQGTGAPATIEPDPAPAAPADTDPAEPATPEPVSPETAEPVASSPETPEPAPEPATVTAAEVPALHSAEARALWEALETHPASTTAELAQLAVIGTIPVRHLLTEWELAGAVWAATDPSKPRAGKRWTAGAKPEPAPAAPAVTEVADTAPAEPDPAPAEPATPEPVVPEPAAPAEQAAPADPAPDTTAEMAVGAPTGDEPATVAPEPPAAADNTATADEESTVERLPAGALRGQVEDFLHENPGKEFTPHQIGKALARSSGAVHNALVKLTDGGTARQTSTAPKKFTLAS